MHTKPSQKCGQIVGKPRYTVYKLLLTTPPRIRLRARFCSLAMIRRLLLAGMSERYQFQRKVYKMGTFSVKNGILKAKLRGWASGWSFLPIHLKNQDREKGVFSTHPSSPPFFPSSPTPFNAYHAGYSQLKLRTLTPGYSKEFNLTLTWSGWFKRPLISSPSGLSGKLLTQGMGNEQLKNGKEWSAFIPYQTDLFVHYKLHFYNF